MNMAADGAALVEARAGAMFGIELYAPWDAPEAVVDVFSEGVVPLRMSSDWSVVVRGKQRVVCFRAGMLAVCESWFRIVEE